jgi:C4-dicarboxylate-specific signal transduction histidine kinase
MAAGIVHELTQPLAAIRNYASVGQQLAALESDSIDMASLRLAADSIVQQSGRAGQIIARVRQLVANSEPQRSEHDLNTLIRNTLVLMETDLRNSSVQVETQLSPCIECVYVDSIQVEQVLVNLLRNAVDAVDGNARGDRRLLITAAQSGDEAVISVRDNGPGFGDLDPDNIFDMFYTTRPDGMGMGLSISRTIASAHGGRLEACNAPDGGAVLRMSLPTRPAGSIRD